MFNVCLSVSPEWHGVDVRSLCDAERVGGKFSSPIYILKVYSVRFVQTLLLIHAPCQIFVKQTPAPAYELLQKLTHNLRTCTDALV